MADWYYSTGDGVQHGPVDAGTLRGLVIKGRLTPADLVWREGMTEWVAASEVEGLFPAAAVMSPPPLPTAGGGYAGFWLRAIAFALDSAITTIGAFCVGIAIGAVMVSMGAEPTGESPSWRLVHLLVGWLYFALMESSPYQATLGKLALGLKVTDLDGYPISFAHATSRHFGKLLSVLTLWIGFMLAGCTRRKQALHDMLAGTLVVRH